MKSCKIVKGSDHRSIQSQEENAIAGFITVLDKIIATNVYTTCLSEVTFPKSHSSLITFMAEPGFEPKQSG